ncbi:MAG TPA: PDZ domain-containing protein [Gemmatimonadales bacterium]
MHRVKLNHVPVRRAAIRLRLICSVLLVLPLGVPVSPAAAQQTTLEAQDRSRGHRILGVLREELEDRYYDATFHGIDLDTLYAKADSAISRATSYTEMLGVLAQFLLVLNDSHTLFDPPPLRVRAQYGISWQPVGEACYVTAVDSSSDAYRQGVRPGDRLLRINQMPVTRRSAPLLSYVYYLLRPSSGLVLELGRDGRVETMEIAAKVTQHPPVLNLQDQATRIRVREEWETDIPDGSSF